VDPACLLSRRPCDGSVTLESLETIAAGELDAGGNVAGFVLIVSYLLEQQSQSC
jgi:hypothetical protein